MEKCIFFDRKLIYPVSLQNLISLHFSGYQS
jgi:hypothetical protein